MKLTGGRLPVSPALLSSAFGLLLARSPYTRMPPGAPSWAPVRSPHPFPACYYAGESPPVRPARLLTGLPDGSSGTATDAQSRGDLGGLRAPRTCIRPLPVRCPRPAGPPSSPRPPAPQVSGSLSRGLALSPRASRWASAHSAILQLTITEPLAPLARQVSSLGLSVPTWKTEAMNQGHSGVSLPASCPLKRACRQRSRNLRCIPQAGTRQHADSSPICPCLNEGLQTHLTAEASPGISQPLQTQWCSGAYSPWHTLMCDSQWGQRSPRRHLAKLETALAVSKGGRRATPDISGYRLGTWLSSPQGTGRPHTKTYQPQMSAMPGLRTPEPGGSLLP